MEEEIKQFIKKEIENQNRSYIRQPVVSHGHNRSDSLGIPFENIVIQNGITLPNNLPSPVAGRIAFFNGQFFKCQQTGTWITF